MHFFGQLDRNIFYASTHHALATYDLDQDEPDFQSQLAEASRSNSHAFDKRCNSEWVTIGVLSNWSDSERKPTGS